MRSFDRGLTRWTPRGQILEFHSRAFIVKTMILYAVRDMITGLDVIISLAIIAWDTISIFFESNKALQEAMLRPEIS